MSTDMRLLDTPTSGWGIEWKRFKGLLYRWLDDRLNRFFDLSIRGPAYRRYWMLVLGAALVAAAFVIHAILFYSPFFAPSRLFEISQLPLFFVLTITRLLILLLIPSFIALTMAGNYLADIFELKDPKVAWDYIRKLVLGGADDFIHIRDGKISDESINSPVILIGGPGRVLVEFDSAAMFEKPDGTPHVLGLGNVKPESGSSNFVLEGFERLREPVINLRDQYIGNSPGESITVVGRSLDGLSVSAADVTALFSIHREIRKEFRSQTNKTPDPFNPIDIQNLIYKQAVPVLSDGAYPSGLPQQWTDTMLNLIRDSLSEFMSGKKLTEYLASIGKVELEETELREDTILSKTIQASTDLSPSQPKSIDSPKFHSRSELSDRFTKYPDGFPRKARELGLDLLWIGVGTWRVPREINREIIDEQHLDAWRLNQENASRSEPAAVQASTNEAYISETVRLIQEVPLASYQKNQTKYSDKAVLAEAILQDYWEQLGAGLELYYNLGDTSPALQTIEKAVRIIEELLRIPLGQHLIGGGTLSKVRSKYPTLTHDGPPAPESREEAEGYRLLLSKLEGNYRVVESMLSNEAGRYPKLSREELIKRILKRFERYGR